VQIDRTYEQHQDGEALKNLALKKGSIQSRKLWGVAGSWIFDAMSPA
jgi:hypothetical protein